MVMVPKRVKYRKAQKGSRRGLAQSGTELTFGEFGLKVLENGWIKNTQLEAARIIIARQLHQGGKFWFRVFTDKPITKKPQEVRMGKGKGDVVHWVAVVTRGRILIELGGVPQEFARHVLCLVAHKLALKTKFVSRSHR